MARSSVRGVWCALWLGLATACLGGQTGQPTLGYDPCTSTLSADSTWSDTTVAAAVQTFEGVHEAQLSWHVEASSASNLTPVDFEDRLQLTLAYAGTHVTADDCEDELRVPVSVTLATSASNIAEGGDGELVIRRAAQGLSAELLYQGQRVKLAATLRTNEGALELHGSVDALDRELPGGSATWGEAP